MSKFSLHIRIYTLRLEHFNGNILTTIGPSVAESTKRQNKKIFACNQKLMVNAKNLQITIRPRCHFIFKFQKPHIYFPDISPVSRDFDKIWNSFLSCFQAFIGRRQWMRLQPCFLLQYTSIYDSETCVHAFKKEKKWKDTNNHKFKCQNKITSSTLRGKI